MDSIVKRLSEQWHKSGVEEGDVLLVHSSLKKLILKVKTDFGILIGPQEVFESLLLSLGKEGTLLLPLFNFDFPTSKYFDIRNTPSQMGALTEIGRLYEGSVRTGHPIYSFAVMGKYSAEFKGVNNKSGYGPDSPFAIIKRLKGKIGIIGLSDQHSMTSYHFVEESNLVDYRYFKDFDGRYIDESGEESERTYSLYVRNLERGVLTDVNRMMDHLWKEGLYKGEHHEQGFGMRTIDFQSFYDETDRIIKSGQAIQYLYSIKEDK